MIHTSTVEDRRFGAEFLEQIMEYIAGEFLIHKLYGEAEIKDWLEDHAEEYGYTQEK